MTPARPPNRAYWSCGGTIVGRSGPLSDAYALQLFRFFAGEALARASKGEGDAAHCCLNLALDLAIASVAAADWARAAGAGGRKPPIDPPHGWTKLTKSRC